MSADLLKKDIVPKYLADGDQKFYRSMLIYALNKIVLINNGTYKGVNPDIELLDCYDRFLVMYRREDDETYLKLAKLFRKVAHRIHRLMLKKEMTSSNNKFLRSI